MSDLTPDARSRALRRFHLQIALSGVFSSTALAISPLVADYGMEILGIDRTIIGTVVSTMYLTGMLQVFSFLFTNRVGDKRRFLVGVGVAQVVLVAAAFVVPLWVGGGADWFPRYLTLMGLMLAGNLCLHLTRPIIWSWVGALVPTAQRGRYLSTRFLILSVVNLVAPWVGLQIVHRYHTAAGYLTVILAGCAVGLVHYGVLARTDMPQDTHESTFSFRDLVRAFARPTFRRYMTYVLMVEFPLHAGLSYHVAFARESGLNAEDMSYYWAAHHAMKVLLIRPIGWLVDRVGTRIAACACSFVFGTSFVLFAFLREGGLPLAVVAWALIGTADAFWSVAIFSTLYHTVSDGPRRTGELAAAQGLTVLSMAIGPLLAPMYFAAVEGSSWTVAGLTIGPFGLLYLLASVPILATMFVARGLKDTHQVRMRELMGRLVRALVYGPFNGR